MRKNAKAACLISFLLSVSFCVSCAPGIRLNRQAVHAPVSGAFNVILYGCNYFNDLETIAFLDKADDRFTFEPFAPDFNYRVKKAVDAKEAVSEADNFVNCNTSFRNAQLSSIVDPDGDVLGYEVRPLYHPFTYGAVDVLYVDYRLKDDTVVIRISLRPSIEEMVERHGGIGGGR